MEPFSHLNRTSLDDESILSGQFWGELRVFLAVAKAKSFNRAAEILNTSQPTVSRQVKRLQDQMGSQLFVPTQHGVKLTMKGQALAQALSRLDHSLFALTNDLKAETKEAEGIVRISITDGLNTFFVAPAIPAFSAEHPKIQLHLKSPMNVLSLRENQTDMMIGFSPVDAADIRSRQLGVLHFIPIVAKSYIHQNGIPTSSNLEQHVFLQSELYGPKSNLWRPWNDIVARGKVAYQCDNSMAYGMLVKAGTGIGLLGSYVVLETNAVPLSLDVKISLPLYACALNERLSSRPVRLVFEWLCEIFGPTNPWFNPEFRLRHPANRYDAGIKMLFNI
jgi:DNA-binding transcriptional LysR family regulator